MKKIVFLALVLLSSTGWGQNPVALEYFNKGVKKAEAGNSTGAIADFTNALKEEPFFTGAYLSRALEKIKIKDLSGAMSDANTP
jgi:Tfp pilus assembly protein PilF